MLQSVQTIRIHLFGRAHLSYETGPLKFNAPPRALSLLAYLLLHRAAPLSRDSVAFALWPDDGESDARSNLRRHLFYLLNDVFPTSPEGPWVLADKRTIQWNPIAPAWCDVNEFERLSANPARAAEAAGLYSGDLLLGVDDEWLEAPRERMRERQIALLLALIAESKTRNDLAAGIAYAKQLLAIDPWREDAVRALIALRHAAGDRAGAMQTYRDFAKRLNEELGVAPMPETTALSERLATAQVEIPVPPPAPSATAPAAAANGAAEGNGSATVSSRAISNLEAIRATPSFTGREQELAALDEAFAGESTTAAIYGMGGIGKSALAREYARRSRDRYALVWWLRAQTEPELIEGLVQLGSTLVPNLEKAHDRRSAAENVVSNVLGGFSKPILLVFDNLEHERLLRNWRPQAMAHTLVTSRHAAWSGDVKAIRLDTWEETEAANYLRRESGRADLSEADARAMAQALGGLPLAFAHAAAYLRDTRTVTARRYHERINAHLAKAPKGAEYDRAVFATFAEGIVKAEEEAPGAASLLRLAAFFAPDAIPEELFHQNPEVYGEELRAVLPGAADLRSTVAHEDSVDEGLGALHRFSLLGFSENRTYTLHRLVQSAARRLLGDDDAAWARSAVAAVEAAFPAADFANWTECQRLAPHAHAALDALGGTRFAPAARLSNRFGDYLRKRAAFTEAEALLASGLEIAEASFGPDDPETGSCLDTLAGLLRDTNRHGAAEPLYRRALAICEAAQGPAHPHVAKILNDLAILLHYAGRLTETEPLFRRALEIDEAHFGADHPTVAIRLNNLALLLQETNRLEGAEPMFRRALAIDEASYGSEHPAVATDLCNLAWLLSATNRLGEAEPLLQRALEIRERSYGTEHPSFAFALSDLGVLLHDGGRFADAERFCRRALAICEASYGPEHPIVAAHFNNLAELMADTNRQTEAEALYRRALAIDEASYGERHPNVARDLNNLAGLLYAMDRVSEATSCLERALEIDQERFGTQHPKVEALRQNLALLARPAEPARRPVKRKGRWQFLRRSPSRGLRE